MLPVQKRQLEQYLKKVRKFHQNTYLLFGLAGVIVVGTLAFHSWPKYSLAQEYKQDIAIANEDIQNKTAELDEISDDLVKIEEEYENVLDVVKPVLDEVFPEENPIDRVTTFLESTALLLDKSNHPMRIENITFSAPKEEDEYTILPFRLNVEADRYNFTNFMKIVEVSGSLLKTDYFQSQAIPLMSISNISMTLPKPKNAIDPALKKLNESNSTNSKPDIPTIIFDLEMHAYSRNAQDLDAAANPPIGESENGETEEE